MIIKILPHGTGPGLDPAIYLIRELDHAGVKRAKVKVLRGNPILVGLLVDSLRTVHRYTSVVMNWHPDERPSDLDLEELLLDFERVVFAGLDSDQYAWAVVLHEDDDGRRHLHFFVARVDLMTGKAMNIAPPKWKWLLDPFRDYWNYKKGWARPDDP